MSLSNGEIEIGTCSYGCYDTDHDYPVEELTEISDRLLDLLNTHEKVYCLFKNY